MIHNTAACDQQLTLDARSCDFASKTEMQQRFRLVGFRDFVKD